ncbi:MAG: SDR family oxidoreductase [Rhodospirillales bacterium]|nr:SDR family oxidoreductase [Rhodospirillales bacterium]
MHIRDSVAIVTGANRGLGQCFVDGLIARGARKVYAGARNPDSLLPLQEAHGDKLVALGLDVTSDAAVKAAVEQAGDVTLLINNAGVLNSLGLMEAGNLDSLHHEMDVNVYGPARMVLAFAPVLAANGGGAILNVLSVASLVAFPPFGSYAASKAAAMSLTHSLGHELQDQNTTVHGLYAGFIDTGMIDYVDGEKTSPGDVVAAALDGIEAGVSEIDADERTRAVRAALREDPEGLIRSSWARAVEFRKAHPVPKPD